MQLNLGHSQVSQVFSMDRKKDKAFRKNQIECVSRTSLQWLPSVPSPAKAATTMARETQEYAAKIKELERQKQAILTQAQLRVSTQVSPTTTTTTLCDECSHPVARGDLPHHLKFTCVERLVTCPQVGCNETFRQREQRHHNDVECRVLRHRQALLRQAATAKKYVTCPSCHERVPPRRLQVHQEHECSRRLIRCRFPGCSASFAFEETAAHVDSRACVQFQRREKMKAEARAYRADVECSWCETVVSQKDLFEHQEEHCPMRERQCPHVDLGCPEWMPVCEMEAHLNSGKCPVIVQREALAAEAKRKNQPVVCPECGLDNIRQRDLRQHMQDECENRILPCPHHIQGCTARFRAIDRSIHENITQLSKSRPVLSFSGQTSEVKILDEGAQSGQTPSSSWYWEMWVWRISAVANGMHFYRLAMEASVVYYTKARIMRETEARFAVLTFDLRALKRSEALATHESNPDPLNLGSQEETMAELRDVALARAKGKLELATTLQHMRASFHRAFRLLGTEYDQSFQFHATLDSIESTNADFFSSEALGEATEVKATEWQISREKHRYLSLSRFVTELSEQGQRYDHANAQLLLAEKAEQQKVFAKRSTLQAQISKLGRKRESLSRDKIRLLQRYQRELAALEEKLEQRGFTPSSLSSTGVDCLLSSAPGGPSLCCSMGKGDHVGFSIPGQADALFNYSMPREQWVHLGLSKNRTKVTLLINGKEIDHLKQQIHFPIQSIGASEHSFHGYMQEVRYWASSSSSSELQSGELEIPALAIPTPNLAGYWTFEESFGSFVGDVSLKNSRGRLVGDVKWESFYTCPFLGTLSPTASYRNSFICPVSIRRMNFAKLVALRAKEIECPQQCQELVTQGRLTQHLVLECVHRPVVCPRVGCHKVYKASKEVQHQAECRPLVYRQELVESRRLKELVVECPFDCGLKLKQRQVKGHTKNRCANRLITCPNAECGLTIRPKNQHRHNASECQSPRFLQHRILVERARTRGSSRYHPSR